MSIERELLKRVISGDDDGDFFISHRLYKDIETFLAQPERKSFSYEEITKAFTKSGFGTWVSKSYMSGFQDAEKAHGIGGEE